MVTLVFNMENFIIAIQFQSLDYCMINYIVIGILQILFIIHG